jgi:hypothetical protein
LDPPFAGAFDASLKPAVVKQSPHNITPAKNRALNSAARSARLSAVNCTSVYMFVTPVAATNPLGVRSNSASGNQ